MNRFRVPSLTSIALIALLAASAGASACATTHEETRDECGHRCSRRYEACARNAFGSDSLHFCGVEADRCGALCPLR